MNETTGELTAKAINVDMEQFKPIKQTAFAAAPPAGLTPVDGKWIGDLRADGQLVRVSASTAVMEWTPDNHLRHSKFVGLRGDKPARSVVRE